MPYSSKEISKSAKSRTVSYCGARGARSSTRSWCTGGLAARIWRSPTLAGCPQVGDQSPGLLHEQDSGGDIPGLEAKLEVAIEATTSDVSQIQRRRSEPAHAAGLAENRREQFEGGLGLGPDVVRESGGDQALTEAGLLADAQDLAVAHRPGSAAGAVEVVEQRLVDGARQRPLVVPHRDRDAKMRNAVRVVGGAVQWVDVPAGALAGCRRGGGRATCPVSSATTPCSGNSARTNSRMTRSAARSASVTRSIWPFKSMVRESSKRRRRISPPRRAATSAAERSSSIGEGIRDHRPMNLVMRPEATSAPSSPRMSTWTVPSVRPTLRVRASAITRGGRPGRR